jgi:pimeloyl-ACP methyl ester carboxylesterase
VDVGKNACFLFISSLVSVVTFLYGCYPQTKIPLDTIQYESQETQGQRTLVIFLPGKGDSITTFQKQGLVKAVRERNLPIDMIAVDAHIGYYQNWTILDRLKQDVIQYAQSKSYNHIWLVGDSMGAYGAVSYAKKYPADITGVVLLGPFLGEKKLIQEITRDGGLQTGNPGDITSATREAWERGIWAWFRNYGLQQKSLPALYLGYGRQDRFAEVQDYLASFMPPEHVISIEGGHDWYTWKKIWLMLLDRNIFY